jgi:hypothetical protein
VCRAEPAGVSLGTHLSGHAQTRQSSALPMGSWPAGLRKRKERTGTEKLAGSLQYKYSAASVACRVTRHFRGQGKAFWGSFEPFE